MVQSVMVRPSFNIKKYLKNFKGYVKFKKHFRAVNSTLEALKKQKNVGSLYYVT